MAQIQIRDDRGAGVAGINVRISEGTQPSDAAIFDVFTDAAGNSGWPIPFWPAGLYTLHVNAGGVDPRYTSGVMTVEEAEFFNDHRLVLMRLAVDPIPPIVVVPPIPPVPAHDFARRPRYGMSIASLIVNSAHNIAETTKRFEDAGVQWTRVNLLSALWAGVDVLPFKRGLGGVWQLSQPEAQYYDRLAEVRDRMNAANIVVQWTCYELYSWSARKPGPQQHGTPWRNNANGVFWPEDDSTVVSLLPDAWSQDWFKLVVPHLALDRNVFEIGNEMPEKALHARTLAAVRAVQPGALISVNRNEDTPGQYANMKIGRSGLYDMIAFHGRLLRQVSDFERVYKKEPTYKTFNQFMARCPHEKDRVIFSSDGARVDTFNKRGELVTSKDSPDNPYDWTTLTEFFREVRHRGYGFEHQSRAKMTPAPNHHMIEVDKFKAFMQ